MKKKRVWSKKLFLSDAFSTKYVKYLTRKYLCKVPPCPTLPHHTQRPPHYPTPTPHYPTPHYPTLTHTTLPHTQPHPTLPHTAGYQGEILLNLSDFPFPYP